MENSEVIEQDTTVQTEPTTENNAVESAPEVLNQVSSSPNKSMYSGAIKPTQQMSEPDHATDIANNAMSNAEADQTFSYTSQQDKSYNTSVNTSTTMSNAAVLKGEFESQYGMNDNYKAADGEDYSWNKLAAEMAQTNYDQESSQARYESVKAKQELDQAASSAFNNYFAAEYSARQTQDKMGWSGGQQTASDLQVAFLQAETAANMYTQAEMQKYGVDTKLGIARMYAEAEQKTLALQYYQDAVDQAVSEANETGCYVSPEAREMMKQDQVARDILNDPNKSQAEKDRANKVLAATQRYYDSLGFQHWEVKDSETGKVVTEYYGIKTLAKLTQEETERSNRANEALTAQANKIAESAAGAAWAQANLAERTYNLNVALKNADYSDKVQDKITNGLYTENPDGTYSAPDGTKWKWNNSGSRGTTNGTGLWEQVK